jgi:predicted RecA/RadA family phage recombinase
VKNQVYASDPTTRRFAVCPTTVKSGDPVLLGMLPAVAQDDYQTNLGGTVFETDGTFTLTVIGKSSESPSTGKAINPGDFIYAVGTLDATTNVTTGLTLDANSSSGTKFGRLDPSYVTVASGATDTAAMVRL